MFKTLRGTAFLLTLLTVVDAAAQDPSNSSTSSALAVRLSVGSLEDAALTPIRQRIESMLARLNCERREAIVTGVTAAARGRIRTQLEDAQSHLAAELARLPPGQLEILAGVAQTEQGALALNALLGLREATARAIAARVRPEMESMAARLAGLDPRETARIRATLNAIRDLAIAVQQTSASSDPMVVAAPRYPRAGNIRELLSQLPGSGLQAEDGWGAALVYLASSDGRHYRIVSGGSDRRIEPQSLELGLSPENPGPTAEPGADIIHEDGALLQYPLETSGEEE